MSDRLAVMDHGHLVQVGPPDEVYDHPANAYVADFLGLANLVPAVADASGVTMLGASLPTTTGAVRGACTVLVRPERIRVVREPDGAVAGTATNVVFAGPFTHVHVDVGGTTLQAVVPNDGSAAAVHSGTRVGLVLPPESLRVLADQSATAAR